ncbi:DNA-directed RNA polymerase III subunit Rpc5 [Zychaea mexicana]|uniref:DNA-directed RNA polymerase III subunit Rpc5 n=1 Tax=Zychaea mexicana TaxID=64656 RepID=UPI0022FF293F|nr:DNA-directed RNA polymerase III subunit Rpc5 [Zychaea mexicana]KAI9495647.1 DNA-directed RNA polymerase III subunit Rpc5 [Zychaea mexicana]
MAAPSPSTVAASVAFDSDLSTAPGTDFGATQADEDNDDEVLAEIPVYLSNNLSKYLYVYQYPLRNAPFTSRTGPVAARIKPRAHMVELDLPIDTRSPHYSSERGEDFAMGMNDKKIKTAYDKRMEEHEEEQLYGRSGSMKKEEELLDRMTFSSTEVPAQTKYVVGALRDGELHLTPVRGTIQMRPAFKYIDKIDEKFKAANKRIQESEKDEEETKKKAAEAGKAQTLQVSMKNAERDGPARRNAYSLAVRNAEEEAWQPVVYYDETTQEAEMVYDDLFTQKKQVLKSSTSRDDYLESLSGIKRSH